MSDFALKLSVCEQEYKKLQNENNTLTTRIKELEGALRECPKESDFMGNEYVDGNAVAKAFAFEEFFTALDEWHKSIQPLLGDSDE